MNAYIRPIYDNLFLSLSKLTNTLGHGHDSSQILHCFTHFSYNRCELNVRMNGQCLKHDPYPMYLGVTSDRTLSYRKHLSCSDCKICFYFMGCHSTLSNRPYGVWILQRDQIVGTCYESGRKDF